MKTVFNTFISLRTIQLFVLTAITVLKMAETRFVVSFKSAPKVSSLRRIIPNFHEVYQQHGCVVNDLKQT